MTSDVHPGKHYLTFWSMEPPYKEGRLRYHLGQVFMLAEMHRLLDEGNEVSAVVCDPPVVVNARSRPESDSQRATIERFLRAVQADGIGLLRLSDLCRDARRSDPSGFGAAEQALIGAFQRVNEAASDYEISSQARRDLEMYREAHADQPLPLSLRGLVSQLGAVVPLHEAELLPLLYAFSNRPSWFENHNLAATGAMLCQLNIRGDMDICVVEANRNAYPWLGLSALCRLAQVGSSAVALEFPPIVLTENVRSLTGGPYMRLEEPAGCLFVDASDRELAERTNAAPANVLAAIQRTLDSTSVVGQGQLTIESALRKYRNRARAGGLLARIAPEETEGADAVHLILRGGGAKGVALVGAADALWPHYPFRAFWGTSAGAIVAVLFGAGYQPDEVLAILANTPVASLIRTNRVTKWWNLLRHGALYAREDIREWLDSLLSAKIDARPPIRMGDLPFRTTIFAAQAGVGTRSFDSRGTGADVSASFAVRSSMSVPFVFRPTSIEGANVYDGGLTNNFPLRQFQLSSSRGEPYIGILLRPDRDERPRWWWRLLPTAQDVFGIWMNQDEEALIREHHDRLVIIDTFPIRTLDLDLSANEVEFLVWLGREQGLNYLHEHGLANEEEVSAASEAVGRLRPDVQRR